MLRPELIRPVWELLRRHAEDRGEALAFEDDRRRVTYSDLEARTARLAGHLAGMTNRHDVVALVTENRIELVEAYLAVVRASCVAACFNAAASDDELRYLLEDSGAGVVVVDESTADRMRRIVGPSVRVIEVGTGESGSFESLATTQPEVPARDDLEMHDAAFMLFTSGTTGRPKGVLLSQHSCLWVVAACWAPTLDLGPDDHLLSSLPLFHSYALDLTVLAVVAAGASERLLTKFSASKVIDLLRTTPVTVLPGVPTMFHYLTESLRERGETLDAPSLRLSASAGAILTQDHRTAFSAVAGVPLLDGYGITETSTMVTMNWPRVPSPEGSCGLPVIGCAVRLVDPIKGHDVGAGEEGELIVRGPQLMLGYHNKAEETANALRDGWYHSGDLARMDDQGFLTITGRIKELIIRGAENISPASVERVLLQHDSVLDVAVAGAPDPALGEIVVAYVLPRDPQAFDESELIEHASSLLTKFMVPGRVVVVEEIPRTGSGKVQRHRLPKSDAATTLA